MAGTFLSIFICSFFFFKRNLVYFLIGGVLFLAVTFILVPDSVLQGQTGRLTTFNAGNFMGQDANRGLAWKFFVDVFLDNPVWGKGITPYSGFIFSTTRNADEFAREMLFLGGHGSYLSLLGIFGVGGLAYFIILVWGGIIFSFRKIKQFIGENTDLSAIAIFSFMVLIIKAIDYITASNGIDIPIVFYIVGFVSAIRVYQNRLDLE
jgi:hypothetical protein